MPHIPFDFYLVSILALEDFPDYCSLTGVEMELRISLLRSQIVFGAEFKNGSILSLGVGLQYD